jgi:hypothetical protein
MDALPPWQPRKNAARIRASSIELAKAVLDARHNLFLPHLREVLDVAVWKHTECDGKHTTRYRSEASLDAPRELVHHEHVIPRRTLIDQLLADPAAVEQIMNSAIGCVVLRSEHATLAAIEKANPTVTGWDRYRLADIPVWDLAERRRVV